MIRRTVAGAANTASGTARRRPCSMESGSARPIGRMLPIPVTAIPSWGQFEEIIVWVAEERRGYLLTIPRFSTSEFLRLSGLGSPLPTPQLGAPIKPIGVF